MTYRQPAQTAIAEPAKTVADDGWSVIGVLDEPLVDHLPRAVDEVASRRADATHPPTDAQRWHRDNGLMGRDMRLLWRDQPRVTLKAAVYLTDVESPDDGALEVVPRSHLDTTSRHPAEQQPAAAPIVGPDGTVAVFDARLWHRRRDKLGARTRRAMFLAYSHRWLTSRDAPFDDVAEWCDLPPIRRQLLGDKTVDPFYWASGELPLDPRFRGSLAA